MSLSYKFVKSPIGNLKLVASEQGLVAILWENDRPRRVVLDDLVDFLAWTKTPKRRHGTRLNVENTVSLGGKCPQSQYFRIECIFRFQSKLAESGIDCSRELSRLTSHEILYTGNKGAQRERHR